MVDLSSLVLTLAPPSTRATARAMYAAVCVFAGSLAIALLAQVSIRLPFAPVPVKLLIAACLVPLARHALRRLRAATDGVAPH